MKFLFKRVIICLCTIVVSTVFVFWAIRLMPGSPIARLVGYENYSETTAKYLTEKYGLDEPIVKQFKIYVKNILKGDFGYSYINNKAVWNIISEKIVPTILLIIPATIISFIIGIWLALKSIYNKKTAWFFDKFSAVISSWPTYVLTLLLLYIFSFKLNIFPISGLNNSRIVSQGIYGILDTIWHLFLPVLSLVIVDFAYYYRITKSAIDTEVNKDYYKYFITNGVPKKRVMSKYILKNAIMPTINTFSFSMTRVVAGALYVEIIFALPGMGRLMYESILTRDYMVLSSAFLLIVIFIVVFMFIVDVVYLLIDPRVGRKI